MSCRKIWKKRELAKTEASPMSSMSFLQTKFWMKRVAKNKEKQRKENISKRKTEKQKRKEKDQKSSKRKLL